MYGYRFDFDGGIRTAAGRFLASPPHVYITEHHGADLMEVLVDPIARVEFPDTKDDDWFVPAFVTALLAVMNDNATALRPDCADPEERAA